MIVQPHSDSADSLRSDQNRSASFSPVIGPSTYRVQWVTMSGKPDRAYCNSLHVALACAQAIESTPGVVGVRVRDPQLKVVYSAGLNCYYNPNWPWC